MPRFIRLVLTHRWLVSVLVILSLGLSLYSARTIRMRLQLRDFYDYPQNPRLGLFKQDLREFGDPGGSVIAVVDSNDVFQPEVLEYVQRVTSALESNPTFARIRSLSNVQAIRGHGDDVVTGLLLSPPPRDAQAIHELKTFALDSPSLRRQLISADGKTTAIYAEMRTPAAFSSAPEDEAAIDVFDRVLRVHPPPAGTRVHLTGAPVVDVAVANSLLRDQLVMTPAVLVVLSILLLITFRSFHGVLLCLTAVGVATIWTAGIFAQSQRPVDLVGSIIPTTIMAYGVVDPIFVLTRVLQKYEGGLSKDDAIVQAFSELALPCFLTSLTTALGFAAFATARQLTISYYGVTVAIGVLLAWVTTMLVLPTLISWVPMPNTRFAALSSTQWLNRALRGTWRWLQRHVPQAIAGTVVVLVAGAWFGSKQHIDNVYIDELPASAARRDVRELEQQLVGVLSLNVYLQGAPDNMKRPEVLQRVADLQRFLRTEPLVTASTSVADLVSEANQAFYGGDRAARVVPSSRKLIAQYLAMIDPASRASFVSQDYARAHVLTLIADHGSYDGRALAARLQARLDKSGFAALGVKASLTGATYVCYAEFDDVVYQLLVGFVFAFCTIIVLQAAAFRSLRVGLISVVPNLLPLVACFAVLRALHMQLKIDTALVLCISVGGLFNTTIHYSARTRQLVEQGEHNPDAAIEGAALAVGPPALFTALSLSAGFAMLMLSSFPGLRALGLLCVVTLVIGFFSDMLVTPVLLRVGFDWRRRIKKGASGAAALLPVVSGPRAQEETL